MILIRKEDTISGQSIYKSIQSTKTEAVLSNSIRDATAKHMKAQPWLTLLAWYGGLRH
jgi:hypothetical protein